MKKEPYHFFASRKPFKVRLKEAALTGYSDKGMAYRFRRHIPLKEGDVFFFSPKEGIVLDKKPIHVSTYPGKKLVYKIGWVPKRIKLAVFQTTGRLWAPGTKEHNKKTSGWLAADLRGYNVGQGENPPAAVKSLILTLKAEDEMEAYERKRGHQVIRWRVHRTPGTAKEMREMEKKARKTGFVLDGVDWRSAYAVDRIAK